MCCSIKLWVCRQFTTPEASFIKLPNIKLIVAVFESVLDGASPNFFLYNFEEIFQTTVRAPGLQDRLKATTVIINNISPVLFPIHILSGIQIFISVIFGIVIMMLWLYVWTVLSSRWWWLNRYTNYITLAHCDWWTLRFVYISQLSTYVRILERIMSESVRISSLKLYDHANWNIEYTNNRRNNNIDKICKITQNDDIPQSSSPISAMHIGQMLITIIVMLIWYHFLRLALETHTLITARASHSIASVRSHYWHFTALIRTFSDTILLHVFLKCCITALFSLLTS